MLTQDNQTVTEFATPLTTRQNNWQAMYDAFRWNLPPRLNIATACCEKWTTRDPERTALVVFGADSSSQKVTYQTLNRHANQFANVLAAQGLGQGDRCAILLPQCLETLVCHFAIYKSASIALPLFTLFGADALRYRLQNSGARAVVTNAANLPKLMEIAGDLPALQSIWCIDGPQSGALDFHADLAIASDRFETVPTTPDDPALLVYTSGTTGPPKGALHAHRVVLGHLPSVEVTHHFFPKLGDCVWTPADWAWMGGLMNVTLPALYYGVPVVAHRMGKFDPGFAWHLMNTCGVRNSFLPPTALKLMRQQPVPASQPLRSATSGGEALGADMFLWAQEELGLTISEIYGQTECNLVLGNCPKVFPPVPSSMGRQIPGTRVAILDEAGREVPPGTPGEIAIDRGQVGMFLRYWDNPEKTASKFLGDWMLTGDIGEMDDQGYFRFSSRDDDVISSAGYRIGPTEIENCLTGHADVVMAAVIGVPDPIKGQAVKAFVVLRDGAEWEGLEAELIQHVRSRLSPHLAPKTIGPRDSFPMTATGKIMRRELREG
ncbi:MAG: AMP-binding protein [Rhodobacteraceae bacterium]|nr:AMP-binding protein [Paracoccaceae bacterium]